MRKTLSLLIAFILLLGLTMPAAAVNRTVPDQVLTNTAAQVYRTVAHPQVGTVGGEWAVLGLARSGYAVPQSYYDRYYKAVEKQVRTRKGILDPYKNTEYSRVILGLTAAGFDPRSVGGYNLTLPLGDFDKTVWQGLNGPIFALLALDCAGYDVPRNPNAATQASRELYIKEILDRQLPGGGFALHPSLTSPDIDVTAMALQALAKYRDRADVAAAVERALHCLSAMRGGFTVWGAQGSEGVVQVIVALCELGRGPDDPRFTAQGRTLVDQLMAYRTADGGFARTIGGHRDQMATEQALYALAALHRWENGLASLYDLSEAGIAPPAAAPARTGPPGMVNRLLNKAGLL